MSHQNMQVSMQGISQQISTLPLRKLKKKKKKKKKKE
jgi:hypothetical protein